MTFLVASAHTSPLNDKGISVEFLRSSISRTINGKHALNSRPFKLTDKLTEELYTYLLNSDIIIKGQMIENKHPNN